MKKHRNPWVNQLTVLGVFFAVVLVGLIYGLANMDLSGLGSGTNASAPVAPPPTVDEYRSSAEQILSPFLTQASKMTGPDLASPDPVMVDLVQKTQELLLRLKVPKEEKEAHLSFVLLLDQWRRALSGSVADQQSVFDNTHAVISQNPWLTE